MHHPVHKQLKAAYSFYNVSENTPLIDLMQDALILAKQVSSWVLNDEPATLLFAVRDIKVRNPELHSFYKNT